jgi:hypothetical protein
MLTQICSRILDLLHYVPNLLIFLSSFLYFREAKRTYVEVAEMNHTEELFSAKEWILLRYLV